jgi:SAM-dependent methyltransferase
MRRRMLALPHAVRRRLRRLGRRTLPPRSLWHLVVPGADRRLERRWAARIRRAPVMVPAEHAAVTADPGRRGAAIEQPGGCPLCATERMRALMHVYDHRRKTPRWDYHVVRCEGCGLLYRHPRIRPDRLGDLYSSGKYAAFLGGKYTRKRITRYEVAMAPFGRLFASGDGRRLLDFGCGNGLFLEIAHGRGFDPYGVDLAEDAVAAARSRPSGRNAHHGSPSEVPEIAAGGFDVITMWSVLAHLAEPVDDLTMLRRLLAPDGVLLLLTVNAGSLKLRRQLETWGGFTPNHLAFFSPETLQRLLARAGFAAVVMPTWFGEPIETGKVRLGPVSRRRVRRTLDRGNRGNMLRAAAFADPDGPRRWGLEGIALTEHASYTPPSGYPPAMADITVFPHGDRWAVAQPGEHSPSKEFPTREAAEMAAREMAGGGAVEVLEEDPTGLDHVAPADAGRSESTGAGGDGIQPADVPEDPRATQRGL